MHATRPFTAAAALALAAALASSAGAEMFGGLAPQMSFPGGVGPTSVAIGDLDGDGAPDLAVANVFSQPTPRVSILLNSGAGAFALPTSFPTGPNGAQAISVAIGDLDGDGAPDLAVASPSALPGTSGNVAVLLGSGDGTFAAPMLLPVGTGPVSVAVGDLNGDGALDLAVANSASGNVSVLLNNGGGTFSAQMPFSAGGSPQSVAIGDLDADGVPDLAVASSGSGVAVLLGSGGGSFAPPMLFPAGNFANSVAIGDLDGDGNLDLAVADLGGVGISGNAAVLLGNGDGTFALPMTFPAGNGPISVAIGDLDADGAPDLAVANNGSDDLSILLNAGDGTFALPMNFTADNQPFFVAIEDLDGDFVPDVVVANINPGSISVFINQTAVARPGDFALLMPPSGAGGVPVPTTANSGFLSVALDWSTPTGFGIAYTVSIALDDSFSNLVLQQTVFDTRFVIPPDILDPSTTHYWSVTAENEAGSTLSTPGAFPFSTAPLIPVPEPTAAASTLAAALTLIALARRRNGRTSVG